MTRIIAKLTIIITFIGPTTLAAYHPGDGPACRIVWISPGGICAWGSVIALVDAKEISHIRNLRIGDHWFDEGQFLHIVLEPSLEIAEDFCAKVQGHVSNIDEGAAKTTYKDLQNRVEAIFGDSSIATCETQAMELCAAAKAYFVVNERWRFIECAKSQSQGGFCERGSGLFFKEDVCNIFGICVPERQENLATRLFKKFLTDQDVKNLLEAIMLVGFGLGGVAAAIATHGMLNVGVWHKFPA